MLKDLPAGMAHVEAEICAAELARARERRDPDLWRELAHRSADLGYPYLHAKCRLRESEARLAARDRNGASAPLLEAAAVASEIGDARLMVAATALARSHRLNLPAAADDPAEVPRTPSGADALGLTPRECQALACLLDGRSNRQIARLLGISEKTAGVHVSNVIRKLGVRTRAEAAAYAHHHHLLD